MGIKKIVLFYGHVASSIGDIAINQGEVNLLRLAFPQADLHFVQIDSSKSRYLPLARPSLAGGGANELSFVSTNFDKALAYQVNRHSF